MRASSARGFGAEQAEQLRHIALEAFSNVLRHAHADHVTVRMACTQRRFTLEMRDDGAGFDPAVTAERGRRGRAQGLANIQRRAELLDATLVVESAPGRARRCRLRCPWRPFVALHDRFTPPIRAPAADVRILIADDHEVVRIGLASLLDRQAGFSVVGEAGSGEEAVRLARQTRPDVVVMDIRMPNGSGIDACRTITGELPATPVSCSPATRTPTPCSRRSTPARPATSSSAWVHRAGRRRPHRRGGRLAARPRRHAQRARSAPQREPAGGGGSVRRPDRAGAARPLAPRDGESNRDIADRMGLAEKTVRNYVSSLLAKLSLESRAQAAGYAIRHRLPELDDDGEVEAMSGVARALLVDRAHGRRRPAPST